MAQGEDLKTYAFQVAYSVILEGLNITNQHIVQYTDIPTHRIEVNTSSGRTILWGMTYEY